MFRTNSRILSGSAYPSSVGIHLFRAMKQAFGERQSTETGSLRIAPLSIFLALKILREIRPDFHVISLIDYMSRLNYYIYDLNVITIDLIQD